MARIPSAVAEVSSAPPPPWGHPEGEVARGDSQSAAGVGPRAAGAAGRAEAGGRPGQRPLVGAHSAPADSQAL